jgi:ABC-type antimicrobial peptide transport system permease subunit
VELTSSIVNFCPKEEQRYPRAKSATRSQLEQFPKPSVPVAEISIVARTTEGPEVVAGAIAAQVMDLDPLQPVADVRALQDLVATNLARPRLTLLLLASFAGAALLLAAIGLYAVMAFSVAQRTREIGVRVALGAQRGDVLQLVMRHGMTLVGIGLIVGTGATLAAGRVVAGLLYGVAPTDPATLAAVAVGLMATAAAAIYIPARRAMRVDPIVALRAD